MQPKSSGTDSSRTSQARGKAIHAATLAAAAVTFTPRGSDGRTPPHGWEEQGRTDPRGGAPRSRSPRRFVRAIRGSRTSRRTREDEDVGDVEVEEDEEGRGTRRTRRRCSPPPRRFRTRSRSTSRERAPSRRAPTADEQITMLVLEMTTNDRHAGAGWFDDVLAQERRMAAAPAGAAPATATTTPTCGSRVSRWEVTCEGAPDLDRDRHRASTALARASTPCRRSLTTRRGSRRRAA